MDKIPQARPEMTDEMIAAATHALQNERLVLGESVHKFEEEFARYNGVKHAISVSSGTDALQLTFIALGIEGKEVITTPLSFIATANAVLQAGGVPRFADASANDNNLDPELTAKAVTKRTAAVMPVHLFGHPCRMDEFNELAQEKGLKVVEDACQAHGSSYNGKKAGAIGNVACFSFYPTKNMTVGGDGGMVTTDDDDLAKLVAKLRDCGRTSRYVHDVVGYTSRLNSVNAAIGRVQLKHLDEYNEKRRAIAKRYDQLLKDIPELDLPPRGDKNVSPVYHQYAIRCQRRDDLEKALITNGVEVGVHYPVPIHLQPVYRGLYGFKGGEYAVSERLSLRLLSLPMFPSLKDDQVKRVAEEIGLFYHRRA
ncbi:MAG: UDP-4-amino-4-deoxy-L-arabinose--oxoglutarate aminotransferase [Methanomassiliicoccales archaeon PtaU1.Bin124]|nr:MAG: UDP-4-amino-4-deoxy-L-arabinose--oxoglutarate aminotransferase [Methanomassiliicoccales archaeon PtaU1.Bin124]